MASTAFYMTLLLPDRASEAVFQRGGANIEYMNLGTPGIDAGYLTIK